MPADSARPVRGRYSVRPARQLTAGQARHVMARSSEAAFQTQLVTHARRLGWLVYHTFDSRRSAPGFPDLILVRGDQLLAIECKSADGRVTDEQRTWLEAFDAVRTVRAFVARSDGDWSSIAAVLSPPSGRRQPTIDCRDFRGHYTDHRQQADGSWRCLACAAAPVSTPLPGPVGTDGG